MKKKLSITIDEKKLKIIEDLVEKGRFRNKSHALEYGLDYILEQGAKN